MLARAWAVPLCRVTRKGFPRRCHWGGDGKPQTSLEKRWALPGTSRPASAPSPHLPQAPRLPPRPGARAMLSASPSAQVWKPLSETASTYPSAGFIHHSGQRPVKAGSVFLRPGRCLLTHGWGSRNDWRLASTDVITQVYVWPSSPLSDCGSWQTLLNSLCGAVSASPNYEKSDYITEPTFSLTIVLGLIFNYSRNYVYHLQTLTHHTHSKNVHQITEFHLQSTLWTSEPFCKRQHSQTGISFPLFCFYPNVQEVSGMLVTGLGFWLSAYAKAPC